MITYLIVNISIILLTVIFYGSMPKSINLNKDRNDNIKTTLFILLSFGILWFIAGFRGDFTSDYKNYTNLFHHYNSFNFEDVFRMYFYEERGYVVFSRFIGIFTNNEVYLMIATSFLILILFFREIKRNSVYAWLSILIFVNIGSYYTSFNITRQIMATAIVFSASKYLYERCLHKYLIIICIASLFHITSLLMIPFYFILNLKLIKKILQ